MYLILKISIFSGFLRFQQSKHLLEHEEVGGGREGCQQGHPDGPKECQGENLDPKKYFYLKRDLLIQASWMRKVIKVLARSLK